ncbi:predicted protein [Uncinocarpus reesii 1704]|uniref:Methyltransferase domain-containing protein n=1 Tax=Uncinocarpus reesii (strain UAMH 1704) TaxID=336963 RepID=C4JH03_UNCRE|nr:uncharacterized protein UREG_01254 [Uncinocarpus reesii 1704]EEP76405.1 predicted protein [Uncinocarpus reesii 1704]
MDAETPGPSPAQAPAPGRTEGHYRLPHHAREIDRLRRQHEHIKSCCNGELLGFPLPPSTQPLRVLDSGCADGNWLLDFASQHPQRQFSLHGVDIGSQLFRDDPRLDLRKHNITQPLPEEWKNSFDIIHQRLLVWALKKTEWPTAIQNLRDVLKPGGRIQLVECNWLYPEVWAPDSELRGLALLKLWSTESVGMDCYVGEKLESLLEEAGFEDVTAVCHELAYGAAVKIPENRNRSVEFWEEALRHQATQMGG